MTFCTSPLQPAHPSSSSQQTPAFHHSRLYSSSSPLTDALVTPRDADTRGGVKGVDARRSVRVRESSGNRSSPIVTDAKPSQRERDRAVLSSVPTPTTHIRAVSRQRTTRPGLPARPSSSGASSTLSLAQAHGISAESFELAREQVMLILGNDNASASAAAVQEEPKPKKSLSHLGRSASLAAANPGGSVASGATSRNASPALTSVSLDGHFGFSPALTHSAPSSSTITQSDTFSSTTGAMSTTTATSGQGRTIRTRSSVEDLGERKRRDEDVWKENHMRKWAEQAQDDSSEEESVVKELVGLGFANTARTPRAGDKVSPVRRSNAASHSPLLPSPPFAASPASTPSYQAGLQPPLAKRGMMERFMSDRPVVWEDKDAGSHSDASDSAPAPQFTHSSPPTTSVPRLAANAASTPLHLSPSVMMTSPIATRGRPGAGFSPDVARLLRNELDEMSAGGKSRRSSPRRRVDSTADIVVDDVFSSPYVSGSGYGGANSPSYSSSPAKRARDVFSSRDIDVSVTKRTRWQEDGPASPTPSSSSLPLRAPSFCDSSPAVSDKESNATTVRIVYSTAHPASAPDFLFNGLPSSSPTSSTFSDYGVQPRHRSSPGPLPILAARPSLPSVSSHSSSIPEMNKRAPLKRAETAPAIFGAEGHAKPQWSYAALIGQAIFSAEEGKISLADIYSFIMASYPYYKKTDSGWQNSIRHNLSLNECFIKTARGVQNPGKGCLWAISTGCEEQFADGGFVKKGTSTNGRNKKTKATTPVLAPMSAASNASLRSSGSKRGRDESPLSSLGGTSPAPSQSSARDINTRPSKVAMTVSPGSVHDTIGSSPPVAGPPPRTAPPSARRAPASADRMTSSRRPSIAGSASSASKDVVVDSKRLRMTKSEVLAPAYVHRVPQTSPAVSLSRPQDHFTRRHALTSPVAASPPTSVYHRLAGPYQPIAYSGSSKPTTYSSQSSAQNHRALALLASPEACIMPVHPSLYDRQALQVPSHGSTPSHFLPAPHIFPGSRRRSRTDSDEQDVKPVMSGVVSSAVFHTQSPVSSMRGGPRAIMSPVSPMSPVQILDEKPSITSDPSKKSRATGLRHLPAVSALADACETFRSPPRHLRSPSTRAINSFGMSTPGAKGRAWGTPGRLGGSPGTGDGAWGWGDPFGGQVEAELERFGRGGDSVQGSGSSSVLPRLYWPSPSAPGGTTAHVPW